MAGGSQGVTRLTGLGFLGIAIFCTLLARYGLRGIFFQPGKPWRLVLMLACLAVAALSGFRSTLILVLMLFAILFYLEGLHRTRMLPLLVLIMVLLTTLMVAFANRLPLSMQRSLAFLPVDIDPMARMSADASTTWRLQMWSDILPEVPQYLILGKGYGFSAREMAMIQADAHNNTTGLASTELAGDYHNGPLSVVIPFGIFGVIGFVWFLYAVGRVLYENHKFGNPQYRTLNTFIFAYFIVKILFFVTIFGSLTTDLTMFVGLVGLSISLNSGVATPAIAPQPTIIFNRFKLHPSVRRPLGV